MNRQTLITTPSKGTYFYTSFYSFRTKGYGRVDFQATPLESGCNSFFAVTTKNSCGDYSIKCNDNRRCNEGTPSEVPLTQEQLKKRKKQQVRDSITCAQDLMALDRFSKAHNTLLSRVLVSEIFPTRES